ncbi:MAG TPA: hypothetical protein VF681_14935 [Abditibacteriaceae bacterium]|jgi:hypothetical protein
MTEELQRATALLDEIVEGWAHPKPIEGYPDSYELRPEDLLRVATICGAIEGTALGDNRMQWTLGHKSRKVYEVSDAVGKLRSVLARLATVIDEMRSPELKTLEADYSTAAEKRKYELRQNSVHGFDTTFAFEGQNLHVETSNGIPGARLQNTGVIIEVV